MDSIKSNANEGIEGKSHDSDNDCVGAPSRPPLVTVFWVVVEDLDKVAGGEMERDSSIVDVKPDDREVKGGDWAGGESG